MRRGYIGARSGRLDLQNGVGRPGDGGRGGQRFNTESRRQVIDHAVLHLFGVVHIHRLGAVGLLDKNLCARVRKERAGQQQPFYENEINDDKDMFV